KLLIGMIKFMVISTTRDSNRAWEWAPTGEPKHDPPPSSGPIQPEICSVCRTSGKLPDGSPTVAVRIFVLLPDGRLWAANDHRFKETDQKVDSRSLDGEEKRWVNLRIPVPVSGVFVGSSSWVQLAADWDHVFGIQ